jgi:hypothetical protein
MSWTIELRGGDYDGWEGDLGSRLAEPVAIAWYCGECSGCEGHVSFDVNAPGIIIARAQAYTLAELDDERRRAIYEVGDVVPAREIEAKVAVPAGAAMASAEVAAARTAPAPAGWAPAAPPATCGSGSDAARALGFVLCLVPIYLVVTGVVLVIAGAL